MLLSASQYSLYVLERLGRFILTNAAPSTSLTSTSSGSSEGSTTTYRQANKSNFVLIVLILIKDGFHEETEFAFSRLTNNVKASICLSVWLNAN